MIARAAAVVTGPTEPILRWDRQIPWPIEEGIAEPVAEDPEGPVAMVVQEADRMAVVTELRTMAHGRTIKGARKVAKETAKEAREVAAQEAADLEAEAALVGGPTVQDGGRMVQMMLLTGQPCSKG